MSLVNQLVRLFRALSGRRQRPFAAAARVHPSMLAKYETDDAEPPAEALPRMARQAGLTVADGKELLRHSEKLRQRRNRAGQGAGGLLAVTGERLNALLADAYQGLLRLSIPEEEPRPEDRCRDLPLWLDFQKLGEEDQLDVVSVSKAHQSWVLVELACEESEVEASRDLELAASRARVAVAIAEKVQGPKPWCSRVKGFAAAHLPNVERVAGRLEAADAGLDAARRLWEAGADPLNLLDPGRLLDLEASLRRAQRRLTEALDRLGQAMAVGRCKERYLIKRGSILEAMGRYDEAVEALLQAKPLVEQKGDARLLYMQRFNLAVVYTHTGRFSEAAALAEQVRTAAGERGDVHEISRVVWLRGRIAAGLGETDLALSLLNQAREEFESRNMDFDVALALLEIAALLLRENRTAEVKLLAADLVKIFESKQIHREALAALQLFHEAVKQERATADLARGVLAYLFLARHNEELRFES
jgi:tetratricopeptide (TPR) repeat protein/transcriptional regulator with XRE-family HTH domain